MTGHDADLWARGMRRYAEVFGSAALAALPAEQLEALPYCHELMLRPEQMEPEAYGTLVMLAGRGGGKNYASSQLVRRRVERGQARRLVIVARTSADVRDVVLSGPSGILTTSPPWDRPEYEPSKRALTWRNGARAILCSAEEPDQLRGPGADLVLCDELAAWQYLEEAWANVEMILREGRDPKLVVTTTPRPIKLLREILADPSTVVRRWSTYANAANLAPAFLEKMRRRYEGTRLGRQELHGEILEDVEGALWTWAMIDAARVPSLEAVAPDGLDELRHVVIGVDPAVTSGAGSAETGIVAAGVTSDRFVVLADRSLRGTPDAWGRAVLKAYDDFNANEIVVEGNQGRDLLVTLLRGIEAALGRPPALIRLVSATAGKRTRAEPVSMLYEQRRVVHLPGLEDLESQMTSWVPGEPSPDRVDALCWAIAALVERTTRRQPVAEFRQVYPAPAPAVEVLSPQERADQAELDRWRKWLHG